MSQGYALDHSVDYLFVRSEVFKNNNVGILQSLVLLWVKQLQLQLQLKNAQWKRHDINWGLRTQCLPCAVRDRTEHDIGDRIHHRASLVLFLIETSHPIPSVLEKKTLTTMTQEYYTKLGRIWLRSQRRKIREYILVNNDKQQTRFMTLFWGQPQWSSIRSTRVSWHQNNQLWIWLPYGVASGGTAHSTTRADDVLKHASRQHYRNSTLKLSR